MSNRKYFAFVGRKFGPTDRGKRINMKFKNMVCHILNSAMVVSQEMGRGIAGR